MGECSAFKQKHKYILLYAVELETSTQSDERILSVR